MRLEFNLVSLYVDSREESAAGNEFGKNSIAALDFNRPPLAYGIVQVEPRCRSDVRDPGRSRTSDRSADVSISH